MPWLKSDYWQPVVKPWVIVAPHSRWQTIRERVEIIGVNHTVRLLAPQNLETVRALEIKGWEADGVKLTEDQKAMLKSRCR